MAQAIDIGEQFAILTGQLEDAHGIAVEGQRASLSADEAEVLVQLLQRQFDLMEATCARLTSA